MMTTRRFELRFLTPAFLGNAEQGGQWRAPPIKALLRQWWRVAWAAENNPSDWPRMRDIEGRLFGHAWLENDRDENGKKIKARQSLLRLRLMHWANGRMKTMPQTRPAGDGKAVASALYLGYGPVKTATQLKMQHPIDADEKAILALAYPSDAVGADLIGQSISLIEAFATVGGRSRNGWGSLQIKTNENSDISTITKVLRDWKGCLEEEWAHAIGSDGSPLIWVTRNHRENWKSVIEDLGQVRKGVNGTAENRERLIINQPVAGEGERVPSNLRFKVRVDVDGRYYGVIYHMPCIPPPCNQYSKQTIESVWQQVHDFLDGRNDLQRSML